MAIPKPKPTAKSSIPKAQANISPDLDAFLTQYAADFGVSRAFLVTELLEAFRRGYTQSGYMPLRAPFVVQGAPQATASLRALRVAEGPDAPND